MASSTKKLYQKDPGWMWKLVVRVIAIVAALVAFGCAAWMTDLTRKWLKHPANQEDGGGKADIFVLPWLMLNVRGTFFCCTPVLLFLQTIYLVLHTTLPSSDDDITMDSGLLQRSEY